MTFKFRKEIIMNKKDYEIKVDGTPNAFKGGAIRYNKNKGRFDLIQEDVVIRLLGKIYNIESLVIANKGEILEDAFAGRYDDAIIKLTCWHYCEMTDETGAVFQGHEVMRYFIKMLPDLAILFQKGAQKYGERNCEAGIPLWSFRDSGLRHLTQYFNGVEDEPHYIHAIWNFCLADWTIHNHPERCYKPESKGEINKDKTPEIPDEKCDDDVKYNESDVKVCEKQFKDEHTKRNDALSSLVYSLQYLLDSGKFEEVKLDELNDFKKEDTNNVNRFNNFPFEYVSYAGYNPVNNPFCQKPSRYTSRNLINDIRDTIGDSWVYLDEHIKSFLDMLERDDRRTFTKSRTEFVIDSVYGPRSDKIFIEAFDFVVFNKKIPDTTNAGRRTVKSEFVAYIAECLKIKPQISTYTINNIPEVFYQTFKRTLQTLFWVKCIAPIFTNEKKFINMFPEIKEFSKIEYFDEEAFLSAVSKLCVNDMNGCVVKLLGYNELKQLREYSRYSSSINESTDIESTENLIQAYNKFKKVQTCVNIFYQEIISNFEPIKFLRT